MLATTSEIKILKYVLREKLPAPEPKPTETAATSEPAVSETKAEDIVCAAPNPAATQ